MALNKRGRTVRYELPPAEVWKAPAALRKAADKLEDLERQLAKARMESQAAEAAMEQAAKDDRAAYALAVADGKGDPGTPAEDAAKKAVKDARRKVHALSDALVSAEGRLRTLFDENREALVSAADEQVTKARDAYRAALDALITARCEFREALGVRAFVAGFPRTSAYRVNAGNFNAITGPNGAALTAGAVLEALRADVDPPPPAKKLAGPPGPMPRRPGVPHPGDWRTEPVREHDPAGADWMFGGHG